MKLNNKIILITSLCILPFTILGCHKNKQSEDPSSDSSEISIDSESSSIEPITSSEEPATSSSEEPVPLTINDFQRVIETSKPTRIVTNQTFQLESSDLLLHYNSSLSIEYSSQIKTCYSYTYEKLNEIVDGSEEFISTVSNTLYSEGSSIYDGVNWTYKAEKVVTLNGVVLSQDTSTNEINDNTLTGSVTANKEKQFFGGVDYNVKNVTYELTIGDNNLLSLRMQFKTHVECISADALVNSVTTFTYDPITIVIPN